MSDNWPLEMKIAAPKGPWNGENQNKKLGATSIQNHRASTPDKTHNDDAKLSQRTRLDRWT